MASLRVVGRRAPGIRGPHLPAGAGKPSRKDFIVTWKVGLKSRTMAIGTLGVDCTLRRARRTAREALDLARRGQDPIEARQRALGIGTTEDLASRFLFEHTAAKKKPAAAPTPGRGWRSHRRGSSGGRSDAGDRGPGDGRYFGSGHASATDVFGSRRADGNSSGSHGRRRRRAA